MIVSASRRTDIPGYYGKWFMNRVRAGSCEVRNPYNPNIISSVSLLPGDVDLFVFWTRNGRPFIRYLAELDERGYRYYFLYTLVHYPRSLEPIGGALASKLEGFIALSEAVGPEKTVWRYDPIVLSSATGYEYHHRMFPEIAGRPKGRTGRVIISFLDVYSKVRRRMDQAKGSLPEFVNPEEEVDTPGFSAMMKGLKDTAAAAGMGGGTDVQGYR